MAHSDNVQLFSQVTPLLSLDEVYSPGILLGQFVSLSILGKSSDPFRITVLSSGDGIDYDYGVQNNWTANQGEVHVITVTAKWTKIHIQNLAAQNMTYLRVFVYGSVTNNAIVAQIAKIGNSNPTVDVGNLPLGAFGQLNVREDRPQVQYVFDKGTGGNFFGELYSLPFSDIKTWSNHSTLLNIAGGVMSFGQNSTANQIAMVWGRETRYRAGQGVTAYFTAYFIQGPKLPSGPHPTTELIGIGNHSTGVTPRPNDGYFFGYADPLGPVTNFGIAYYNGGTRLFYPQTSWNVDRCDGTYIMPLIDFSKMNVFEISYQYLGFGMVRFYVMNPETGLMSLVHTIQRLSQFTGPSNLSDPSVGLLMFTELENGVAPNEAQLTDEIGTASFALFIQGPAITSNERVAFEYTKLAVTAEVPVFSVLCDTVYFGSTNRYPIDVDYISVATDGAKSVIFKIYVNSTLNNTNFLIPAKSKLPARFDTAGTVGSYGKFILAFTTGGRDNLLSLLKELDLHMLPGDILTFTAQSAAVNDVNISVSVSMQ